jgi:hypothetical protein
MLTPATDVGKQAVVIFVVLATCQQIAQQQLGDNTLSAPKNTQQKQSAYTSQTQK